MTSVAFFTTSSIMIAIDCSIKLSAARTFREEQFKAPMSVTTGGHFCGSSGSAAGLWLSLGLPSELGKIKIY